MLGLCCLRSAILLLLLVSRAGGATVAQELERNELLTAQYKSSVPVTAIAFSPDGQRLLCGSTNGVQVLTWPELNEASKLNTGLTNVLNIQFSPAGDRLLIVGGIPGEVGEVEVWDWTSATRSQVLSLHDDTIYQCAWSDVDQQFATASFDGHCTVYDLEKGNAVSRFAGHSKGVLTVQFWNSGTLLSGGLDHSIRMWSCEDGSVKRTLNNHVGHVIQILPEKQAATERTRRLISISQDKTVRLWQPEIGRMVRLERLPSVPTAACWDDISRMIVVGCEDGVVYRLNDETLAIENRVEHQKAAIIAIAVNPVTGVAVSGGEGGVRVLDTGHLLK